jgi:1,4-dihydroxy-2-naphthoate polyprenyltransferase
MTEPLAYRAQPQASRFSKWLEAIRAMNLPEGAETDTVSRWLIMTRAAVIPMTLISGLIGGILAAGAAAPRWPYFALCLVGLAAAHACNNLMNDYFDMASGVDDAGAPRALYAPHPVLSGWVTESNLLGAIAVMILIDGAIMAVLVYARGWPIVAFAGAGFFVSFFYTAPPFRLKYRGLGEAGVFIVWGPLMICGTYFVTAGELPAWVWAASLPYAILVTTVLIGKHIDKLPYDAPRGVRTLPAILGERRALALNRSLMISFYAVIAALVIAGMLGIGALIVMAAVPVLLRTLKLYSHPKPAAPPPGYPVWPLWYVSSAFVHTRRAGALLVIGLLANVIVRFS